MGKWPNLDQTKNCALTLDLVERLLRFKKNKIKRNIIYHAHEICLETFFKPYTIYRMSQRPNETV